MLNINNKQSRSIWWVNCAYPYIKQAVANNTCGSAPAVEYALNNGIVPLGTNVILNKAIDFLKANKDLYCQNDYWRYVGDKKENAIRWDISGILMNVSGQFVFDTVSGWQKEKKGKLEQVSVENSIQALFPNKKLSATFTSATPAEDWPAPFKDMWKSCVHNASTAKEVGILQAEVAIKFLTWISNHSNE